MQGIKHLVQCRCILPQFKKNKNPPLHQFIVFSIIDDDNNVKLKYSQCPNCGVIHKITEISKSEIISGKEHMPSITTVNDIKLGLNERLVAALETADVDISTWENAEFIIQEEMWGSHVVLNKDIDGDELHIKTLKILGPNMFKVDNEIFEEYVKEEK